MYPDMNKINIRNIFKKSPKCVLVVRIGAHFTIALIERSNHILLSVTSQKESYILK